MRGKYVNEHLTVCFVGCSSLFFKTAFHIWSVVSDSFPVPFSMLWFSTVYSNTTIPSKVSHQIFYVFRISLRTSSLLISWTLHREHRWLRIILVHHGPSRIFLGPSSLFLKLSFNKCPVVLDSFPVAFSTLLAGPSAAELWRSLSFFWKQKDKSQ